MSKRKKRPAAAAAAHTPAEAPPVPAAELDEALREEMTRLLGGYARSGGSYQEAFKSPYAEQLRKVEELRSKLADAEADLEVYAKPLREVIATMRSPKVAALRAGQPYDQALIECVRQIKLKYTEHGDHRNGYKRTTKPTGAIAWKDLARTGATDAQIATNLKSLDRDNYRGVSSGNYYLEKMKFGRELRNHGYSKTVILEGAKLLAEVRRVMGIPQPTAAKPAPKPAVQKPAASAPNKAARKPTPKPKAPKPKPQVIAMDDICELHGGKPEPKPAATAPTMPKLKQTWNQWAASVAALTRRKVDLPREPHGDPDAPEAQEWRKRYLAGMSPGAAVKEWNRRNAAKALANADAAAELETKPPAEPATETRPAAELTVPDNRGFYHEHEEVEIRTRGLTVAILRVAQSPHDGRWHAGYELHAHGGAELDTLPQESADGHLTRALALIAKADVAAEWFREQARDTKKATPEQRQVANDAAEAILRWKLELTHECQAAADVAAVSRAARGKLPPAAKPAPVGPVPIRLPAGVTPQSLAAFNAHGHVRGNKTTPGYVKPMHLDGLAWCVLGEGPMNAPPQQWKWRLLPIVEAGAWRGPARKYNDYEDRGSGTYAGLKVSTPEGPRIIGAGEHPVEFTAADALELDVDELADRCAFAANFYEHLGSIPAPLIVRDKPYMVTRWRDGFYELWPLVARPAWKGQVRSLLMDVPELSKGQVPEDLEGILAEDPEGTEWVLGAHKGVLQVPGPQPDAQEADAAGAVE